MLKGLKRGALGLLAGELIYMFRKDEKFRKDVNDAEGIDKLKKIGEGLLDFNKGVWSDLQDNIDKVTKDLAKNDTVADFKSKFADEYDAVKAEIDKLVDKATDYKDSPEVQKIINETESKLESRKKMAISKYNDLNEEYHFDDKIDMLIAKLDKAKNDLSKDEKEAA